MQIIKPMRTDQPLINGRYPNACSAAHYNRMSENVAAYEREGLTPPDSALNARHKAYCEAMDYSLERPE